MRLIKEDIVGGKMYTLTKSVDGVVYSNHSLVGSAMLSDTNGRAAFARILLRARNHLRGAK